MSRVTATRYRFKQEKHWCGGIRKMEKIRSLLYHSSHHDPQTLTLTLTLSLTPLFSLHPHLNNNPRKKSTPSNSFIPISTLLKSLPFLFSLPLSLFSFFSLQTFSASLYGDLLGFADFDHHPRRLFGLCDFPLPYSLRRSSSSSSAIRPVV